MKFKYLGTAAAEGWPGMFCTCESCKKAIGAGIAPNQEAVTPDSNSPNCFEVPMNS